MIHTFRLFTPYVFCVGMTTIAHLDIIQTNELKTNRKARNKCVF